MHEVGSMFAQYLNVNPAVVSLAFVYGALDTLDQYSMSSLRKNRALPAWA